VTRTVFQAGLVVLVILTASMQSFGGPPLICHPFQIDDAKSISWGQGPFDPPKDIGRDKLVQTVLAHLQPDTPVLARMETLRRATIWCGRDGRVEQALLFQLMGRALDAQASGEEDAMAIFDAGFFAQCLDQVGASFVNDGEGVGVGRGVVGYAWVRRAIELRPNEPQMHFAAALITAIHDQSASEKHMKIAKELSGQDALLAANIKAFKSELGKNLDHHRENYARSHGS
jgi:hypothetical protein